MLLPLQRYADFKGRAPRREYWWFSLEIILVVVALVILLTVMEIDPQFALLALLPIVIPGIAVEIRRFHDLGKSGWFILLGLIPFVGGLIIIYFMVQPSMAGPNQYGPNPYEGSDRIFDGTP